MARLWRAFQDDASLAEGRSVALAADEAHHVRRVLRLGTGDAIAVFDGRGREWSATIVSCGADEVSVSLGPERRARVEAPLDVTLYQGRSRPDRFELVVQKATELGVRAIVSLDCERAEGRPPDERRLMRWRRMTIEACKQSGRRRLPELRRARGLPPVEAGVRALLLDTGEAPPVGALAATHPEQVWLAVGPESGFSAAERDGALAAGWVAVSLGPRILRTETAGIVAAGLVLHRWGDLGDAARGSRG